MNRDYDIALIVRVIMLRWLDESHGTKLDGSGFRA